MFKHVCMHPRLRRGGSKPLAPLPSPVLLGPGLVHLPRPSPRLPSLLGWGRKIRQASLSWSLGYCPQWQQEPLSSLLFSLAFAYP